MNNAQVQTLEGKFNTAQLELLKVVARPVSDDDLRAIKKLIVKYFIDKLRDRADEVWVQNNWTEEEVLSMNLRVKK
jgi:hypothetical protein